MVDLIIESDFSFLHVTQLFNFLRFGFVEKKIQSVSTQLCDHTDHYFPSPYSKKMSYIVFPPSLSPKCASRPSPLCQGRNTHHQHT